VDDLFGRLGGVEWAGDSRAEPWQAVKVNFGGLDCGVPQKFFEIMKRAAVQEVLGGKGMPEGVTAYFTKNAGEASSWPQLFCE
jgi:hypothetical protein